MASKTYSVDAAAALLNMGRNTLLRRLRELGLLGADNLPAGRERGGPHFRVVPRMFRHPVNGWTHYGRTEITAQGLSYIAKRLGAPTAEASKNPQQRSDAMPHESNPSDFTVVTESNTNGALPEGTLHDAGEFTVVTQEGGRTHHRAAMVLVFDSPSALQRAIDAHRCAYRARRDIPEAQLHPEQAAHQG
jgi:hypothetical protein